MPYKSEWVARDIAIEHKGVTVYHSYKDDNYHDPYVYWFCLDDESRNDIDTEFDVRRLPNYQEGKAIKTVLKEAIELGHIKAPEE